MTSPETSQDQTIRPPALSALRRRIGSIHPARRSGQSPEAGVVAIEFVLVLPFLIAMLVLIISVGKAFNYKITETHLASEGARFAAVDKAPGDADIRDYIHGQVTSGELKDGGDSVPDPLQVCIDFPNEADVGNEVTVQVESTYRLKVPFIGMAIADIPLVASATHRLERKPSYSAGCS